MVAAEALIDDLEKEEIKKYEENMKKSWVFEELYKTRNFAPSFKYGLYGGTLLAGLFSHVTRGLEVNKKPRERKKESY